MSEYIVEVQQGKLRGTRNTTRDGIEYISYLGIPFAKPPIGELRFKAPLPPENWQGIRDASVEGNMASQHNIFTKDIYGSDDCLYMNVFVPIQNSLRNNQPIPVMVNIHGGGFVMKIDWGPDYMLKGNVIVVNFNYRLGVIGFLCTDSSNATGDMGLRDQNVALRWVKENIGAFGGDSDNVTLIGVSAGAASVEYHLLSKLSEGLFHKAIMHSGSALNPWARTRGGVEMARRLTELLKYDQSGGESIFDFINKHDSKTLIRASIDLLSTDDLKSGRMFCFTPVLLELENHPGFIHDEPIELLKRGEFAQVPVISGLCEKEGMMMVPLYLVNDEVTDDFEKGLFFKYVPSHLGQSKTWRTQLEAVYRKRATDKNDDDFMMDFLSDLCFDGSVLHSLKCRLECKNNSAEEFFYRFTFVGNQNMVKALLNNGKIGASHADDISFLGPTMYVNTDDATEQDKTVIDWIVTMWTNFAKTGKTTTPGTIEWLPMLKDNFRYLEIGSNLKMCNDFNPERRKLWNEIHNKANNQSGV